MQSLHRYGCVLVALLVRLAFDFHVECRLTTCARIYVFTHDFLAQIHE